MSFHNHDTDDYNKKYDPQGRKEEGMIQKHLTQIKKLGFYYELVNLLELQRAECLSSIMDSDFYRKHKNDFPKSYILTAPTPKELEQWKDFVPNSEPNPDECDANGMPNEQEAGQTPDSLKQARETLYWQQRCEAAEKLLNEFGVNDSFDVVISKSDGSLNELKIALDNYRALKALQEEQK